MFNIIPLAKLNDKANPEVRKWRVTFYFLREKGQSYVVEAVDIEISAA